MRRLFIFMKPRDVCNRLADPESARGQTAELVSGIFDTDQGMSILEFLRAKNLNRVEGDGQSVACISIGRPCPGVGAVPRGHTA